MPRIVKPLTELEIKRAKAKAKDYTKPDGKGLQLCIKVNGRKIWEFVFLSPTKHKRRKATFKTYPEITLKQARDKAKEYRELINQAIDPIDHFKEEKRRQKTDTKGMFENVFNEWIESQESNLTEATYKRKKALIQKEVTSKFKNRHIKSIKHPEIVTILENKSKKTPETAKRLFSYLDNLWRYATMKGYTDFNIIANIHKSILQKVPNRNYAKITDRAILKELVNDLYSYDGHISTRNLLKFVLHIPLRASNLVTLRWEYIDFENRLLTIPRELMKNKNTNLPDFKMPLSDEILNILKEQQTITGNRKYIFVGDSGKHLHPETGNRVLMKLDYNNEKKGRKQRLHSFRGTFRSIAETEHPSSDIVKEIALDHYTADRVKLAYSNKANYEKQLRELMEWWSGYLVNMLEGETK